MYEKNKKKKTDQLKDRKISWEFSKEKSAEDFEK